LTAPTAADDTSFTVTGNWEISGTGIFTPGTGRVYFDATSGGPTITTSAGTSAFNDVTFNDAGNNITWTWKMILMSTATWSLPAVRWIPNPVKTTKSTLRQLDQQRYLYSP